MVSTELSQDAVRDYSRSANVLIAIQLRLMNDDGEECDDPDPGICTSVD
jgi:hypothetical protein